MRGRPAVSASWQNCITPKLVSFEHPMCLTCILLLFMWAEGGEGTVTLHSSIPHAILENYGEGWSIADTSDKNQLYKLYYNAGSQ